jgi:hypothetical protein
MRQGTTVLSPSTSHDLSYLVVLDRLFSLLLEGYIGTLAAVEARSTRRGNVGDVCSWWFPHHCIFER